MSKMDIFPLCLLLLTFAVVVTYDSKTTKNELSQKLSGRYHRDMKILTILTSNSKQFRVYGIFKI